MRVIADFHTHSRFAMACSSSITISGMAETGARKGINLLSTSDFLHKEWLSELRSNLEEIGESGLFRLKGSKGGVRFMLGGEVCTVFTGIDGRGKKIHTCIMLPSFDSVLQLKDELSRYGALESDGRPSLSMTAAELVEKVFSIDKRAFVFAAHVWTPFFGALGSISGFNSMKEAYGDQEKNIYAIESGLSSDPAMNWRVSGLDKYAIVSNSDMHSLEKLGREANVFEFDKDYGYDDVVNAIKNKDQKRFKSTIEFYPEEGKYHFDGHRECEFSVDPSSGKEVCDVCGKKLVIGVLHRVNDLADRPVGYRPANGIPYINMVPLREIIAYAMKKGSAAVGVEAQYRKMLDELGEEFEILINVPLDKIKDNSNEEIAQCISNVRENKINIVPGYAGVFGEIDLLWRSKKVQNQRAINQKKLFK
ncbi:MAG TPA: endonuclease Q family protein [Candidatus Baltobacteraceae bacterium]|nr:endonuclease Q family protein [Candidatus Baltobacteraceae bacterium]